MKEKEFKNSLEPLKEGWRWVRLGEVCEIIKGKKPFLYDVKVEGKRFLPYLTAEVLRYDISPQWCDSSDKNAIEVKENEIIIIADGSYSGDIFMGSKGILASTMGKLKVNSTIIITHYLFWFIKYNFNILNSTKRGGSIPHLEKDIFYNLNIPLPSIETQRRIVLKIQELMEEVERARTACEKQLEAVKALPSAYLREVFESDEAKRWERKRLKEVCCIQTGKKDVNEGAENGEYLFFTCADKPLRSNSFSFEGESIILPGNGANVGLVLYYEGKFEAYQRTYVLNCFSCHTKYVYYHLISYWKKHNEDKQYGSATNYIRLSNIQNYLIPLPPLETQRHVASYLQEKMAKIENLQSAIQNQLSAINALPQSILRKAFRGEL